MSKYGKQWKLIETHLEKIRVDDGAEFEPFY